jgi:hypothetical protein
VSCLVSRVVVRVMTDDTTNLCLRSSPLSNLINFSSDDRLSMEGIASYERGNVKQARKF